MNDLFPTININEKKDFSSPAKMRKTQLFSCGYPQPIGKLKGNRAITKNPVTLTVTGHFILVYMTRFVVPWTFFIQ